MRQGDLRRVEGTAAPTITWRFKNMDVKWRRDVDILRRQPGTSEPLFAASAADGALTTEEWAQLNAGRSRPRLADEPASRPPLSCDYSRVAAAIELQSAPGLIRAELRRFLVCPRCQTRGNVVGCHAVHGWSCPTCGRWSGRRLRRK